MQQSFNLSRVSNPWWQPFFRLPIYVLLVCMCSSNMEWLDRRNIYEMGFRWNLWFHEIFEILNQKRAKLGEKKMNMKKFDWFMDQHPLLLLFGDVQIFKNVHWQISNSNLPSNRSEIHIFAVISPDQTNIAFYNVNWIFKNAILN